jgi:hypothetical protein
MMKASSSTPAKGLRGVGFHTGLFAVFVLVFASMAFGDITGRISGVVKDPSGAVIPGVAVTALNTQTGIRQTVMTNVQGFYAFPALPIGLYEVDLHKSGFKDYRATNLVINVNSVLRVDATLQLGKVTQAVTVTSTALHVQTTSTQMGDVITGHSMVTLPLNGRTYLDLMALQPGVVPESSGGYGDASAGGVSVSGQREDANGFMINGGNVEGGTNMTAVIIPDLDSIAEFRIITNNFNAEYGNYSGGLVNVATKSGTNQFHGDVFEFLRNPNLDSRNFFSATRATLHRNQFGGTIGGPITHNKVFFFADYQGTREVQGVDKNNVHVPTAAEQGGNFSALSSLLAKSGIVKGASWANTLSTELGYPVSVGEHYFATGCTTPAKCVFPNAIIPQSAISAPAKALLKYIPLPNSPNGTFSTSAFASTTQDDLASGRVDANTRWGMVSGYYFIDDNSSINPYAQSSVPGFSNTSNGRSQQMELWDTKSFGPTMVNLIRLNYVRSAGQSAPVGGVGPTLSSLGFAAPGAGGIYPMHAAFEGVPHINLTNFSFGETANAGGSINNTFQVGDDFTKVAGTHTIKFGGETHLDQIDHYTISQYDGVFTFNGNETGNDFADFLLGAPNRYVQGAQFPIYDTTRYYGLYAQDSWRARSNLTLNYGLRWEVSTPWYEQHNQQETLIPGVQSVDFPGAPTGWLFPGDPGVPRTLGPIRYHNFAPRIGLAYSPSARGRLARLLFGGPGRSSIRMSYGVFFTPFEEATAVNESGDAPFGAFYVSPVPPLFSTPFVDRATGNSEGQRFPVPTPPLNVSPSHPDNNVNWAKFEPISSSPGFFHTNRLPYAEHYMFSYERQFGSDNLFSMSYVGTQGHELLSGIESNIGNPALCLSLSQPSDVLPGTQTCGPDGESGTYFPVSGGVVHGTRAPFGQNFGSNDYFATMGNSNYNALEVSLQHRSGRSEFLAGYTYSKVMDNASTWGAANQNINPINPKLSKSLSSFDMEHNFVVSYAYDLPFDKLLPANRLTRGWVLTGITRFSTGLPVYIWLNSDNSLLGAGGGGANSNGVDEPNFTPGNLDFTNPRSGLPYFNTSLFSNEPLGQLGTANKRFFAGPGLNNWDIALLKDLKLTESKTLEFRAEFFNAFNHAQFNNPNGNFGAGKNFGLINGAGSPRIGQVALKLYF